MPYTYGGVVGSRCQWTASLTQGGNGGLGVMTGWFLPTTLTATRRYFAYGAVFGARVASTTSEIEMLTDNATTDGVRTTSGCGMVVDQWQFLAFIWAVSNTGPASNWRVYRGTVDTAPTEVTVNNTTAPVGNLTGSTTVGIGNDQNNSTAFQGDIAHCSLFTTTTTGVSGPLGISAATTITQAEADRIRDTWIMPLWLGRPDLAFLNRTTATFEFSYWPAEGPGANVYRVSYNGVAPFIAPTLTSSVVSTNGPPRPTIGHPLYGPGR